jgi:lactate dehydrogenase-like 2-hydroxyacid dehydrogenase
MTKPRVLCHPGLGAFEGLFSAHYDLCRWPLAPEEQDVEVAIGIGSIGLPPEAYDLPHLKLIACFAVGYDKMDLAKAKARKIAITNCPDVNGEDVADHAMGLIISCTRNIAAGDRTLRAGGWNGPVTFPPPRRIKGQKLGIVGMGAIGKALAHRAASFGMEIAWTGPRAKPDIAWRYVPDLLSLAHDSDVLALCLRPDPGTDHMVNAAVLAALGPEGVLINVARGSVVDEAALLTALRANSIKAAGLDVFAHEPTQPELWADLQNVTVTPHIAGGTRDSIMDMVHMVLANVRRHYAGEALLNRVV